ncbi:MAG: outer membrane beta-barrel protein [Bacteroidales bacterium]|nr:outer membrane beta-barrel protein [Bacteroidales bacterium]
MKKVILVICRWLLVTGLAAGSFQQVFAQTGNIAGRVHDKESASGIPFANVVLVKASDSTQVMGTASSDSGYFQFRKIPAGTYFVQVAVLGYHRSNSPVFSIDAAHRDIQLGTIEMTSASVQLDKVVIRAKRPMMEMEAGKITMNVSQSLVTQADNAFEMLKKFPGVTIDKDDNISLNGRSGVLITVDDRPTRLDGQSLANYLRGMPANTIDKIEVMTNPSSKYDAEGTGGIINFKTNRLMTSGFSGSLNGGIRYSNTFGGNGGLDLNYRHKHFTLYANGSVYGGGNKSHHESYTQYADGSRRGTLQGNEKNNYFGFYGKGGIDAYLSKRDVMSLAYSGYSGNGGGPRINREAFYPDHVHLPDSISGLLNQDTRTAWKYASHTVNFNYEHKFDTVYDRKLSLNLEYDHSLQNIDYRSAVEYSGAFSQTPLQGTDTKLFQPFKSNIYSLKLDYEHPFNMQTRLEAGIKFSYVDNNSRLRQESADFYRADTSLRNLRDHYLYHELIGAAYIMLNHTFKTKTALQVGIRAEYTYTEGISKSMDSLNTNQYIRPFPNITISQPIGNKNQLSLSYRYRLSRPDYSLLNPFVLDGGAGQYQCGNPRLQPEYSHNLSLTYSFNYKFFATVNYIHTDGTTGSLDTYIKEGNRYLIYSQPVNAGKGDFVGLDLSTQLTFFKIWRLNVFLNGSYGNSSILYEGKMRTNRSFNAGYWLNTEVDATSYLTLSAYGYGSFPSRSNFTKRNGRHGLGLGLKAFFLEKTLRLSASFDVDLSAYGGKAVYPTAEGNTVNYWNYHWEKYAGRISLSWRFGNNMNGRGPRHLESSDESSRLGGGGGGGRGN